MDEGSSSCTVTQRLQTELESSVGSLYKAFNSATSKERSVLLRLNDDDHEDYVLRGLVRLGAGFYVLDSSRPWLCYWILHSLALLGKPVDDDLYDRTVDFLEHCQDPNGGYAGGPGQMPHLATTYAAVCALVTLGGKKALASINREKVLQFLTRMKDPCGGFRVHDDGEMDMRGSFTALAVAHLLNIMEPKLVENVAEHVKSCQTYEGGIGGELGSEAHGGYTFCGIAAVALINQLHVLDLPSLVNWVAFRQGKVEGGFQGRTNKLVDGCYSFWQAGCFQLLQQHMPYLLSQQSTSVAALYTSHDNQQVTNDNLVDGRGADHLGPPGFDQDGNSDHDGVADLESRSESDHNAAEKLFPMIDIGFYRRPVHVKCIELDEADDDQQGTQARDFGSSSSNSSRSTSDLDSSDDTLYGPIFNSQALQAYILLCCQDLEGGLRDKPGKPCDYYHTCYCLSGLAVAQYSAAHRIGAPPPPSGVVGSYGNLVEATHALCNVRLDRYYEAVSYFKRQSS